MKFTETELEGVWLIRCELIPDERGAFGRTFCVQELEARGLDASVAQISVSVNKKKGTLRGLHYQGAPYAETKIVRVQRGRVWDVALDIRKRSPSYGRWFGVEITAASGLSIYVPTGFAHGFVTLSDDTEVLYQMSVPYVPELARGVRWNDPSLGISWPCKPEIISHRDRALPMLSEITL